MNFDFLKKDGKQKPSEKKTDENFLICIFTVKNLLIVVKQSDSS